MFINLDDISAIVRYKSKNKKASNDTISRQLNIPVEKVDSVIKEFFPVIKRFEYIDNDTPVIFRKGIWQKANLYHLQGRNGERKTERQYPQVFKMSGREKQDK